MMTPTGRTAVMRTFGLTLVLMMIIAPASNAVAQKRGNSVGAPAANGGGTTAAANRGGAGGVSNTDPGGEPATAGGPRSNDGPTATETSRSGYLGGRGAETVTPPVDPPSTTITTITEARFGKCPMPAGTQTYQSRTSGNNLGRIETVSRYLTNAPRGEPRSDAIYLLADLQEELQKSRPDLTLVGTYLGIVATSTITPALATDVSKSLCATISPEAADRVAEVAETQRRKLTQPR